MEERRIRRQCEKSWDLLESSNLDHALKMAGKICEQNPTSALAFNSHANMLSVLASKSQGEAATEFAKEAKRRYETAIKLAPRCVYTVMKYSNCLSKLKDFVGASCVLRQSLAITEPDDPVTHHVACRVFDGIESRQAREEVLWKLLRTIRIKTIALRGSSMRGRISCSEYVEYAKAIARSEDLICADHLHVLSIILLAQESIGSRKKCRSLLVEACKTTEKVLQRSGSSIAMSLLLAKILYSLGEYERSETVCYTGLRIESASDPLEDAASDFWGKETCDGIGGYMERVEFVKEQLRILLRRISVDCRLYWVSLPPPKRTNILKIKVDALLNHNANNARTATVLSAAWSVFKAHGSWRIWYCPIAKCNHTFSEGSHLSNHIWQFHLKDKISCEVKVRYEDKHINVDKRMEACKDGKSDVLRIADVNLFSMFPCIPEAKQVLHKDILLTLRSKGNSILEEVKERTKIFPTDKSTHEYVDASKSIMVLWTQLCDASVVDYFELVLTIVRKYLWKELQCMIRSYSISTDPHQEEFELILSDTLDEPKQGDDGAAEIHDQLLPRDGVES